MSRLTRNIVYNLSGQLILMVLGFVAVKYTFQHLGEDALGIIYFAATINMVLRSVLDMGMSYTTVRAVSSHYQTEPQYIKNLIHTFSLFYWILYIIFGIFIFLFAPILIDKWLILKIIDSKTAIYAFRILSIGAFIALPISFYSSLFRGLQRMEVNNLIDVLTSVIQQLMIILVLVFRGNIFHVVWFYSFGYILRLFIYLFVSGHFFTVDSLIPMYYPEVLKRNLRFAAIMISVSVTSALHTQADKIIISKLIPIGIFGYYAFAYNTISKTSLFTGAIFQAAFPSFSSIFKSRDRLELIWQYQKLQDIVYIGLVPIFAAIIYFMLPLFSYLLNEEAAKLLFLPTTLLCLGFYMNGTLNFCHIFAIATDKPGISARQNIYALFVILPSMVLLVRYLGLSGAALSWILYQVFGYIYGIRRIYQECLEIRVSEFYFFMLKIFLLAALTYGALWKFLKIIGITSIISLTISYAVATIVFLIGSYIIINAGTREMLYMFFFKIKAKIMKSISGNNKRIY